MAGLFQDVDEWDFYTKAICVSDAETYNKTQLSLVTNYMKFESQDAIRYATNFTKVGDTVLGKYHRHGEWDYVDGLPKAVFISPSIDVSKVEPILRSIENSSLIYVIDAEVVIPHKQDWVMWLLQQYYGYRIGDNVLLYNGKYYCYRREATYATDEEISFDVVMKPINSQTRYVQVVEDKYVTPVDATTETQHVVVKEYVTLIWNDTGVVLSNTVNTISYNSYNVPIGTGVTGVVQQSSSNTPIFYNNSPIYFTLPTRDDTRRYFVKYTINSQLKYWIYDPNTHQYPSLDTIYTAYEHKAYPIVAVRRIGHNIQDDSESSNPVAKKRYISTKELLEKLGVSLETLTKSYTEDNDTSELYEATFLLGIRPKDTSEITSIALYNYFDYMFDKLSYSVPNRGDYFGTQNQAYMNAMLNAGFGWGVIGGDDDNFGKVYAKYQEENYEMQLSFTPVSIYEATGNIGLAGTCTHHVGDRHVRSTYKGYVTSSNFPSYGGKYYYFTVIRTDYTIETGEIEGTAIEASWSHYVDSDEYGSSYGHIKEGEFSNPDDIKDYLPDEPHFDSETGYDDDELAAHYKIMNAIRSVGQTVIRNAGYSLVIKKQINDTMIRVFVIQDMEMFYSCVSRKFFAARENLQGDLVLPLTIGTVERLTPIEKTKLLNVCFHMFFWSAHHTHLAWYETAGFGKFIQMITIGIAVFVTLVSWGTAGPSAFGWASSISGWINNVLVPVGASLGIKMLMEIVDDPTMKMLLGIAATLAITYSTGGFDNFSWSSATKLCELPSMAADIFAGDVQKKALAFSREVDTFNQAFQDRASTFKEIMEGFNTGGLTTAATTGLMLGDTVENDFDASIAIYSPSQFRAMAIDAHRDFNWYYTGFYDRTVHKFCKQSLRNGLMPSDMAEE